MITQLFVAGQEVVGGAVSRATGVVGRILALDESVVRHRLEVLAEQFDHRHRDLHETFSQHAERVGNRLDPEAELSRDQWLLLGAAFTHEYAIEAAALCNPSMVVAPDGPREDGSVPFVMSVRGIGEGHRSSIGFRTGTIAADGAVSVDAPEPFAATGAVQHGVMGREVFHARLRAIGADGESAASVLEDLPATFSAEDLDERLDVLLTQRDTRLDASSVSQALRAVAACSYRVHFDDDIDLSERVLAPVMAAEAHGLEDARFVRFVDDDGAVTYYATYTAFDGARISQQLLQTDDFVDFSMSPMVGPAENEKGLALFPRRIGGRFAALCRLNRETNAVALSDSLHSWRSASTVQIPVHDWDAIQLGNCGSPIETEAGWLVLTHGVGPMRVYSIGALLLDLDDPTRLLAELPGPLLTATADEQDGYVPNVVYSCGGLVHGDHLVVPYGIGDAAIGFATANLSALLTAMRWRV